MTRSIRALAGIACLALLVCLAPAQTADIKAADATPAPTLAFDIADVHASPHDNNPFMRGGALHGDRYILRQATMVDLIANAYAVENDNVLNGPAWLDTDRFDIAAKAPRTTSPDDVRLMLRGLLTDRFKLTLHADTKPLPAFVLSVGKGGSKMKEAAGSGLPGCDFQPPPQNVTPGPPSTISFSCHNERMDTFVKFLRQVARPYLTQPAVDSTGLTGSYDFDIKWNFQPSKDGGGNTIFDAVDKQLGLKLEAKTAPLPVVIVDSVNEKPTPNPAGLDKAFPPPPPSEFDVAVIKPSPPDVKGIQGMIRGDQVNLQGGTLQFLITFAWNINDDMVADPPKWLNQDKFDLIAKAAVPDATPGPPGNDNSIDIDDLRAMVKNLLADRFKLQSHMEDRPADAYTLLAANPKMKKADPLNRTGCKEGPGPDGKDPRIANPVLGRLLSCQNMSMAQFADRLQSLAPGYIKVPVLDSTRIDGAYDFTLSFSGVGQLRGGNGNPPPAPSGDSSASSASASTASAGSTTSTAADPSGGLSLPDAIYKQLGLKLEKQKRPVPMLVIDHIEEKPTEN